MAAYSRAISGRPGAVAGLIALLVVQVGMAHPARLHGNERLPRPGLGHQDRRQLDRLALTAGYHALHADRHRFTFSASSPAWITTEQA